MRRYAPLLVAAALAVISAAPVSAAFVECQTGDVQCYRTCYLPNVDKQHGIYWNYC